ncbi:MAG TPA: hypothetical protein VD866_25600 [Urbifossiella sp.]|nr:hypothetical protein [Urbifossiella sp.]
MADDAGVTTQDDRYVFHRGTPGIWTEIYFPKKAAYQGAIFDALRTGFRPAAVKRYLSTHVLDIRDELRNDWPELLDPNRYDRDCGPSPPLVTEREALERIEKYESVFFGYSVYSVDGVFYKSKECRVDEEATQVVRLLLKFDPEEGLPPVRKPMFVAMCRWLISQHGAQAEEELPWQPAWRDRFLAEHPQWPGEALRWASEHYRPLARAVAKWIDDCGLFLFGYLVRHFSERVLREGSREDEIWVASIFSATINVVRRQRGCGPSPGAEPATGAG